MAPVEGPALSIEIGLRFHVRGDEFSRKRFVVNATRYTYSILREVREWFSYQWDPTATRPGAVSDPHVHIGKYDTELALARIHLPTGFVPFTAVLRMLMRDLGVPPLRVPARTDLETQATTLAILDVAEDVLIRSVS